MKPTFYTSKISILTSLLITSIQAGDTYTWTDNGGNNNWVGSSNWNQDPGSGDHPGENHNDDFVELKGSKWGSGGTNHFDIDLTTSSSASNFTIASLDISTDGSTDAWKIQDGAKAGQLTVSYNLFTTLNGGGNAAMYGDLKLIEGSRSYLKWKTSGNKFVLHGSLLGNSDVFMVSLDSNGGGMTLKSAGTFAGEIVVANNTLDLDHVNALQNAVVNGNGGTLEFINNANIAQLIGNGGLSLSGTNLNVGGNNDNFSYSGNLTGTSNVTKVGTGTWTRGGTSTHSGRTTVNAGNIKINSSTALQDTQLWLNVHNGLDMNDKHTTVGGLGGGGNLALGTRTLSITGGFDTTHLGIISGTGTISIDTSGVQSFGSSNTYSGGTHLLGGTLRVDAEGDLGASSGPLTMGHATYQAGETHPQSRRLQFAYDSTNAVIQVDSGKTLTWSGLVNDVSANQTIKKTGSGVLAFTNNANTFPGTLDIDAGSASITSTAMQYATIDLGLDDGLTLNSTDTTIGSLQGSGDINMGAGKTLTFGGNNQSTTYSGSISGLAGSSFTKTGTGEFLFSGSSNLTAKVNLNEGNMILDGDTNTVMVPGIDSLANTSLEGNGRSSSRLFLNGNISPDTPGVGNTGTIRSGSMFLYADFYCDINGSANDKLITAGVFDPTGCTLKLQFHNGAPNQAVYTIATYGFLAGEFGSITGLPAGYKLDYAYNGNSIALVQDNANPSLSSMTRHSSTSTPTKANTVKFDVSFSENVTGVTANDFNISYAGSTGTPTISGSGSDYVLSIPSVTGDGTLTLNLKTSGHGIEDEAQNSLNTPSATTSVVIDNTAPVITLNGGGSSITLNMGDSWSDPSTATDNIDNSINVQIGGDTVDTNTPGIYNLTYNATDTAGNTATQMTRTITVRTIYQTWAATKGLTGNDALPSSDPDKDGRINQLEFAFDGNPSSPAPDGKYQSAIIDDEGTLQLSVTRPFRAAASFSGVPSPTATIDGITYTIQGTTDFATFDTPVEIIPAVDTSGLPALNTGWEYRSILISLSPGQGYIRVKVE